MMQNNIELTRLLTRMHPYIWFRPMVSQNLQAFFTSFVIETSHVQVELLTSVLLDLSTLPSLLF